MNKLTLILLFISSQALADGLSITTLNWSYHFPRELGQEFNERHSGIGFEYKINADLSAGYLNFRNSYYHNSDALYIKYDFVFLGAATGYDKDKLLKINDSSKLIGGLVFDPRLVGPLSARILLNTDLVALGFKFDLE